MKIRNSWVLVLLIGLLFMLVPLISALVTATGAFGSDPVEKVNRIDFVWAGAGLIIAAICLYRLRSNKNT